MLVITPASFEGNKHSMSTHNQWMIHATGATDQTANAFVSRDTDQLARWTTMGCSEQAEFPKSRQHANTRTSPVKSRNTRMNHLFLGFIMSVTAPIVAQQTTMPADPK